MRAVIFTIFIFIIPPFAFAAADESEQCHIDSTVWFSTGWEEQDQYLCILEWSVEDIQFNPAPAGSGAAGTCMVLVELIGEDDPRLETLTVREDGNAQVWVPWLNRWLGLGELEKMILDAGCTLPTS